MDLYNNYNSHIAVFKIFSLFLVGCNSELNEVQYLLVQVNGMQSTYKKLTIIFNSCATSSSHKIYKNQGQVHILFE